LPVLLVATSLPLGSAAAAILSPPLAAGRGHGCRFLSRSSSSAAVYSRVPVAASASAASSTSASAANAGRRPRALGAAFLAALLLWSRPDRPASAKPRLPKPVIAQDKDFQEVKVSQWVQTARGQPDLVLGLKGDPYWLLPGKEGGALRNFALRAECTHLGCIAPWDARQRKFVCPCHGSEYDEEGNVLRGPAPQPLALAHVELTKEEKILLSPWTEEDFRDDSDPWWI